MSKVAGKLHSPTIQSLQGKATTNIPLQTFLKLSNLPFNILPSTNHASPTGSLPFLLPPRDVLSPTTTAVKPIPASKLHDYALTHASKPNSPSPQAPIPSLRQEAYQSLIDVSLRNAFLYTLYLDPRYSSLLDRLYIHPSTSSTWIQATLRHQLCRAAEAEILKTTRAASGGGGGVHGVVDPEEVYRNAREALEALASELVEARTAPWENEDDEGEISTFESPSVAWRLRKGDTDLD